jgi:uncharacterized membrane protein YheB (UPF0754 family)
MQIDMSGNEARDAEAIRALVEYTWKQENIDKISKDIRLYTERITAEMKKSIEDKVIIDAARMIETRTSRELRERIKQELNNEIRRYIEESMDRSESDAAARIASEIRTQIQQEGGTSRSNVRLYFIGLSLASMCLGAAIAAVAILVS